LQSTISPFSQQHQDSRPSKDNTNPTPLMPIQYVQPRLIFFSSTLDIASQISVIIRFSPNQDVSLSETNLLVNIPRRLLISTVKNELKTISWIWIDALVISLHFSSTEKLLIQLSAAAQYQNISATHSLY